MPAIVAIPKTEHDRLRELFERITRSADSESDARHDLPKRIERLSRGRRPPIHVSVRAAAACDRHGGAR